MAKAKFVPKTAEELEKELNELSEQATNKVENFFNSKESVMEHLRFMGQFHNYSVRNTMLIESQFMGAQGVGSFQFWRSKGVSIKKGEKGIKLLTPTPVQFFQREGKTVQLKNATPEEKALIEAGKLETNKKTFFKIGHVFDYTQTNAREKGFPVSQIFGRYHRDGTIENDEVFYKAFEEIAKDVGVKLLDTPIEELGAAKGAFYPNRNVITMNPRNTPAENISVMLHELAHAELHNKERQAQREKPLSTAEKEFQAEMTAFLVSSRYGIDTENFSIPYLASWTKNATLGDKEKLIGEVKTASSKFIETIDAQFEKELLLEKNIEHIGFVKYGALSSADLKTLDTEGFKQELSMYLESYKGSEEGRNTVTTILEKETFNNTDLEKINETLADNVHVFDAASINEPKALISFSEHDKLNNNTMYRFAEANEIASGISFEHERDPDTNKMGYYKTRYSVILPNENGDISIFANTDRLDLGDGEYKDMHHQLLREGRWSEEQQMLVEEDIKKYNQENALSATLSNNKLIDTAGLSERYLTNMEQAAVELTSKFGGEIDKPLMKIHGISNFQEFGAANQLPFEDLSERKFEYTAAYPANDGIKLYSSSFNINQSLNPLHDIEKHEKLPANDITLMSENWHDYLQKEEEAYLEKVVPRLKQELHANENIKATGSKKQRQTQELER